MFVAANWTNGERSTFIRPAMASATVGRFDFLEVAENSALTLTAVANHGNVINTQYHVLRRANNGLAVSRLKKVARGHHHSLRFIDSLVRQRHVNGHLVAVEVRAAISVPKLQLRSFSTWRGFNDARARLFVRVTVTILFPISRCLDLDLGMDIDIA